MRHGGTTENTSLELDEAAPKDECKDNTDEYEYEYYKIVQ